MIAGRQPTDAGAGPAPWWRSIDAVDPRRVRWIVWALLALPFVIAALVLQTRHWQPVLDLAMTELRVRDVGTSHTPLIGLPGRIGVFPDQGSHPGPLSFYLLAPTYRILGASAWALLVGMIVLNLVAIGLALWLAERRGGPRLVVGVGALLAVLEVGYGFDVLTQPWNPYLPLLFWTVILLGTWSVLDGDTPMLVVVSAVGSLCAQTHIPYLGLGLGMGALCIAAVAREWYRHPVERARLVRWVSWSVVAGIVLWIPVVIDQFTESPGNLSMLKDYFRDPPESPVGAADGIRLLLRHLDVVHLLRELPDGDGFITRAGFDLGGSIVPGLVLLVVWVAAAVLAWRSGHRLLRSFHVVIGWALVLGAVSMSRIFGKVWYYLTLWGWTTTIFMVASIAWTVAALVRRRDDDRSDDVRRLIGGAVAAVGVTSLLAAVVTSFGVQAPEQYLSDSLRAVVGPTAEALDDGDGDATGHDGRYIVTWNDARNFGSQGYGLVNELERRGFDVGVLDTWRVPVTHHRVISVADATAEVRFATGSYIDFVATLPGSALVTIYDPRSPDEMVESTSLRAAIVDELTTAGLGDLVPVLDTNMFGVQVDARVAPVVQRMVDRLLHLGGPTAVFILPPGSPL
ncbi:MAG: hypothetical protein AB7U39_19535 [Ilumatobacteraceae bacterium]